MARDASRRRPVSKKRRNATLESPAIDDKYGYRLRSLVEGQILCIRRCIGARLLTRKIESHERESVIIGDIVDLWNAFFAGPFACKCIVSAATISILFLPNEA